MGSDRKQSLSAKALAVATMLATNLPFYCEETLWIQTKSPTNPLIKFKFNFVQTYLHNRVELHKKRHGKVRIIIVKGRQQTCSTYVTGRFFHNANVNPGTSVYILSHEASATKTLFSKVDTYYHKSPSVMVPELDEDNAKTLGMANGSQYTVGTAKAEGTGRSGTNHYFHGSEAAHYPNGANVQAGALQTVPPDPGSEVFLETTANGMNWFWAFVQDALRGWEKDGDVGANGYEVVFIPWYWTPEYRAPVPDNFSPTKDELRLQEIYGIDDEQLQWRRLKMYELKTEGTGSEERLFKQEYPFTLEEAFQASGDSMFDSLLVDMSRKSTFKDYESSSVGGLDPASYGDRIVFACRQGRQYKDVTILSKLDTGGIVGHAIQYIKTHNLDKLFIDRGGLGVGVVDGLRDLGWGQIAVGVDFSNSPSNNIYNNKRTEMYCDMNKWLQDYPNSMPDMQEISTDLASIPPPTVNRQGEYSLPAKEEIKKKLGRSPDVADAMVLCHAYPVRRRGNLNGNTGPQSGPSKSPLQTSRVVDSIYKQPDSGLNNGESMGGRQLRSLDEWRSKRDWGH